MDKHITTGRINQVAPRFASTGAEATSQIVQSCCELIFLRSKTLRKAICLTCNCDRVCTGRRSTAARNRSIEDRDFYIALSNHVPPSQFVIRTNITPLIRSTRRVVARFAIAFVYCLEPLEAPSQTLIAIALTNRRDLHSFQSRSTLSHGLVRYGPCPEDVF